MCRLSLVSVDKSLHPLAAVACIPLVCHMQMHGSISTGLQYLSQFGFSVSADKPNPFYPRLYEKEKIYTTLLYAARCVLQEGTNLPIPKEISSFPDIVRLVNEGRSIPDWKKSIKNKLFLVQNVSIE